jgi:alkylhydroperoxidase/carboxymuconolactone decarboxylase family protein YurZ
MLPLTREKDVSSSVTHFEIYAEKPPQLAEFYQSLLGWRIEQAPGIDYWRIQSGANTAGGINGGLTYRPFPGLRSWVHYVHVDSLDHIGAIYGSGVMPPKEVELLSIAFDASYTHMYAPGTRRHIKGALKAGATMEEIMEVLKLCIVQGAQACNLGVPILAEEIAAVSEAVARP